MWSKSVLRRFTDDVTPKLNVLHLPHYFSQAWWQVIWCVCFESIVYNTKHQKVCVNLLSLKYWILPIVMNTKMGLLTVSPTRREIRFPGVVMQQMSSVVCVCLILLRPNLVMYHGECWVSCMKQSHVWCSLVTYVVWSQPPGEYALTL